MSTLEIKPIQAQPEFDIMYFMEVSGLTRLDQDLLAKLESAWMDWKDRIRMYRLGAEGEEGFLLAYLHEKVEEIVEEAWEHSQQEGEAFHNLAVTLVMAAAQAHIPQLLETGCAPLPKPGRAVLDAFEELGLEWNAMTASLNRQYAVFTPDPYRGGCEICYQGDVCPKSTVRGDQ